MNIYNRRKLLQRKKRKYLFYTWFWIVLAAIGMVTHNEVMFTVSLICGWSSTIAGDILEALE